MCEFETEQRKKNKAEMTERQTEMSCWGWKFEQYLTAGKIDLIILKNKNNICCEVA